MIRSTKHTLKYTNKNKIEKIKFFVKYYRVMVQKYINLIWNQFKNNIPKFLDSSVCNSIKTIIKNDSVIRQCAAKQAIGMVKSVLSKHKKRLYKLKQLQKEGKNIKYLQSKIDRSVPSRPKANKINIEFNSKFVNIKQGKYFDLFIEIKNIGNKRKIRIPIKLTKVDHKWMKLGKLKQSIRLNEKQLVLYYEIEKKKNNGTKTRGADQGKNTCLIISDGQATKPNKDGYDLNGIIEILERRKKGSKGFRKAQEHRKNYINWSLNQLNFSDIKEIRLEKLVNLRKGKKVNRKLSHWTYTQIKTKLIALGENKGFIFKEQDNKYRSQRCSQCGWTHKLNRVGKTFKCTNIMCGFTTDSDLNAACNHEVDLIEVPLVVWQKHLNRTTGFFWLFDKVIFGHESTVHDVKKLVSFRGK